MFLHQPAIPFCMKNKILSHQSLYTDAAILILRLVFGVLFMYHGYAKIVAYHEILPQFPDMIGIGSKLSFHLLIFAEFFCGFFVAIGILTRLSVIPIFIAMAVAYFIAHGKDPFDMKELSLLFMILSGVIFLLGGGKYSLDRLIFTRKSNSPKH